MVRIKIIAACLVAAVLVSACAAPAPSPAETEQADMAPQVHVIVADEALEMMAQDSSILLIDVRAAGEFASAHAVGALNLPLPELVSRIGNYVRDENHTVILYCQSGQRSRSGAQALIDAGHTSVYDAGGIIRWTGEIVQ